jgi:hypothetical protein
VNYLERIQNFIQNEYRCRAQHVRSVPVEEKFQERVVFSGYVEVFSIDHPQAKYCFAWGFRDAEGAESVVAVLNIPPVVGAHTAVHAAIVTEFTKQANV